MQKYTHTFFQVALTTVILATLFLRKTRYEPQTRIFMVKRNQCQLLTLLVSIHVWRGNGLYRYMRLWVFISSKKFSLAFPVCLVWCKKKKRWVERSGGGIRRDTKKVSSASGRQIHVLMTTFRLHKWRSLRMCDKPSPH